MALHTKFAHPLYIYIYIYIIHDGLFGAILLHLDITLVITQKYDQVES